MSDSLFVRPLIIPKRLRRDRAVRRLLTAWMHAHARYRLCTKRVNMNNPAMRATASRIEKKRRKERWTVLARILTIEHTLIRWVANATRHPDIWTDTTPGAPESTLFQLERDYYENRRNAKGMVGALRQRRMRQREALVMRIRALNRAVIVILCAGAMPDYRIPNAIPQAKRDLLPKKLKTASKMLRDEMIVHSTLTRLT